VSALCLINLVLLAVALLSAGDALRQVCAWHHPAHAAVLALIVVAAFAGLVDLLAGERAHGWTLALHALMAVAGVLGLLYPPIDHAIDDTDQAGA
jgi:ABC-type transport system involved in cytochrome c biogenesis permease subunit